MMEKISSFYGYVCKELFFIAEPKNIFKSSDLKSFSSIWPLMDTFFDELKIYRILFLLPNKIIIIKN